MLVEDEGLTNKERRFRSYRFLSNLYEGYLGRGVRRQLPKCLHDEIVDTFPKGPHEDYTGFIPGESNNSDVTNN